VYNYPIPFAAEIEAYMGKGTPDKFHKAIGGGNFETPDIGFGDGCAYNTCPHCLLRGLRGDIATDI
jgi:hypothetical protein